MQFLNHMTLGQYVPADSFVHHLDPRCKIVAAVALLTGVFLVSDLRLFPLWALLLPCLAFLARIPLTMVLRSARPVVVLVLLTALIHVFFTKGEAIWQWGIVSITGEGLVMAARMGLRLLFLVLFAGLLTLTTSPMELSDGLERLFSPLTPLGFPAHDLAMMMTIALRFIPTLLDETDRIMKAQLARGADLDRGNVVRRLRAFIPVLVPLFVIVFQRADDLATAMEARGYRGGRGRTRLNPLKWRLRDGAALAVVVSVVIAAVVADRILL